MVSVDSTVSALLALPYRLGPCVGAGGAGEVYRAWTADGIALAIKVAHRGDDTTAALAAREADVASRLPQAWFPALVDRGRLADGRPWLAMEWIDGGTLAERLTETPWSVSDVAALGSAIARALAAAHARGIVHRDLKPGNVMFRDDGSVVLVDLGLARHADDPALSATRAAGTPVSMAPEQVLGDAIGPAADLYALGALLYRLRAGRDPFTGGALELQLAHLGQPPAPLPTTGERGEHALGALVAELLRKHPGDRPSGAAAVATRLAALARPPRRVGARLAVVVAALAVTVGAIAGSADRATATLALAAPRRAPPIPAPLPDRPWVMTDAGAVTLRASWTTARAGGSVAITVELWDADGRPLSVAGVAATLRDPARTTIALTGATLRRIEVPVRRAGDYQLTVFYPDGDLSLAVTIPVGAAPTS